MKVRNLASLLLAVTSAATTVSLSMQAPAIAGDYGVTVECHGDDCYGIVVDLESGEEVDATEPQKNEKQAYRQAGKLLEKAEAEGVVSQEWAECHANPRDCDLLNEGGPSTDRRSGEPSGPLLGQERRW